jgi:hypothetical protein
MHSVGLGFPFEAWVGYEYVGRVTAKMVKGEVVMDVYEYHGSPNQHTKKGARRKLGESWGVV